jgi:hypothetical protein
MVTLDTSVLQIVLREIVDPRVRDLTDTSAILWNLVTQGEAKEITARGVRQVAEVRRNPSMLWFAEGGKYPPGGSRKFLPMNMTYARFAIAARMTRDALEHSDANMLVNVITDSVQSDTKTGLKEFNQQAYRDGSGVKAVVEVRNSGTQVTTAVPFRSRQLLEDGAYNFFAGTARSGYVVGQKIGTGVSTLQTIVNSSGLTTFDTVHADVVAGDIITWENSYARCIHGLDYIIDNGTGLFQNASRADYRQLRSLVDDAGGALLTVARMNKMLFQAKYLRGNTRDKTMFTMLSAPAQVHRYASLGDVSTGGLTDMPAGRVLDLGYTAYKFGDMTWIEDVDCPDDVLYFLNLELIQRFVFKEFGIVPLVGNENGIAPIPGFDANGVGSYFDAGMYVLTFKGDLGSPDPQNAGMKIKNLSTSGLATGLF